MQHFYKFCITLFILFSRSPFLLDCFPYSRHWWCRFQSLSLRFHCHYYISVWFLSSLISSSSCLEHRFYVSSSLKLDLVRFMHSRRSTSPLAVMGDFTCWFVFEIVLHPVTVVLYWPWPLRFRHSWWLWSPLKVTPLVKIGLKVHFNRL